MIVTGREIVIVRETMTVTTSVHILNTPLLHQQLNRCRVNQLAQNFGDMWGGLHHHNLHYTCEGAAKLRKKEKSID